MTSEPQRCAVMVREDEVDRFEGVKLMHPTYCGAPIVEGLCRVEGCGLDWAHYVHDDPLYDRDNPGHDYDGYVCTGEGAHPA